MTRLSDEGFLSTETDAVVATIRARHDKWFAELRATNALLVRSQYRFSVHIESAREVVSSGLYIRTLVHCQAAVLLIERGMDASARAMIRCALEGLFNLGACARDPATALAFVKADEADRKRKAKYLLEVQGTGQPDADTQSRLNAILEDAQRNIEHGSSRELKARAMAKGAGLEALYLTAYSFYSGAVHSSVRDLEQHFKVGPGGRVSSLVNEPMVDNLDMLCRTVGEIMVLALEALAKVFELDVAVACDTHMSRIRELFDDAKAG